MKSADDVVDRISDYAAAKLSTDLSPVEAEAVAVRILDTVCSAYLGRTNELVSQLHKCRRSGLGDTAALLVTGGAADAGTAALINGVAARCLELNDTYFGGDPCHPSDLIMPALALGEAGGRSGIEVARAIACGYGLLLGMCDAAEIGEGGWDHSTYAAPAGAVLAAQLLDLSREQMNEAVALAVVNGYVSRETRSGGLSRWKGMAFPYQLQSAISAALMARIGITGPPLPYSGKFGFVGLIGESFELVLDVERDSVAESHIKSSPVVYHAQGAAQVAAALRAQLVGAGRSVADVADVAVTTYATAAAYAADSPAKWRPTTRETADHSIPYITATYLSVDDVRPHDIDEGIHDARLLDLVRRVQVGVDPTMTTAFPADAPVRMRLTLHDGVSFEASCRAPVGHASNPVDRAGVRDKWIRMGVEPSVVDAVDAAGRHFVRATEPMALTDFVGHW